MFPIPTQYNMFDARSASAEHFGDGVLGHSSRVVQSTNFENLDFRKFGLRSNLSLACSSLLNSILDIVSVCSKKKMFWIAALWIVALVTDKQRSVKVSIVKKIRESVRSGIPPFGPDSGHSISSPVETPSPMPTLLRRLYVHLFPKSFIGVSPSPENDLPHFFSPLGRYPSNLSSHRSLSLICATLSATQGARAFSFSHMAVK